MSAPLIVHRWGPFYGCDPNGLTHYDVGPLFPGPKLACNAERCRFSGYGQTARPVNCPECLKWAEAQGVTPEAYVEALNANEKKYADRALVMAVRAKDRR